MSASCYRAPLGKRHTTFRFRIDPTVEQAELLNRHAGAARFAFNQCLRLVKTALDSRATNPGAPIPWSGFDLINAFNAWKKTEAAGRLFTVDSAGIADIEVTGLAWRTGVCQQVFEESAVDCARALGAWSDSRSRSHRGRRVGFPRFKKKSRTVPSFRLRNRLSSSGPQSIRVGGHHPRSVTLPRIGDLRVYDDTRPLRRLLAKDRGRVLFATVSKRAGRWWVALNVEAAALHVGRLHELRAQGDRDGWVGVDRGLSAFLVAADADGHEIARVEDAPRALRVGLLYQRRLAKKLARAQKGSRNRADLAARLGRHHHRVASIRSNFLHQTSNLLVKNHDRLVLEDLHVAGMMANHRLARAISDAGWTKFARILRYKQAWRGGVIVIADRWFPSTQLSAICGSRNSELSLSDRVIACVGGHSIDRDLNAAVNLARWDQDHYAHPESPDPKA